jgi:hypothetical protein
MVAALQLVKRLTDDRVEVFFSCVRLGPSDDFGFELLPNAKLKLLLGRL